MLGMNESRDVPNINVDRATHESDFTKGEGPLKKR